MPKIPNVFTSLDMEHFLAEDKYFVRWEFDPQPDLGRPWVTRVGCRCHRSMLNPLYGHLSITHSALPPPLCCRLLSSEYTQLSLLLKNSQFRGQVLHHVGVWSPQLA